MLNYPINLFKALYSYHHRLLSPLNTPIVEDVEVSSVCNFNCVFCARDQIKRRGVGLMLDKTFFDLVSPDNRRFFRHIQLFGHGEPTIHPNLVGYVKHAKTVCKSVSFTSNGQLLVEKLAKNLLDVGLSSVCFSFEGTDKSTYESLRRGGNFETVQKNIWDFTVLRDVFNRDCGVKIAIIDCEATHDKIPAFIELWESIVDEVVVLPLHDWGGILNVGTGHKSFPKVCFWGWYGFAVQQNGDVSPCCLYEGKGFLGNVNKSSIMNIWLGERYRQFRKALLTDRSKLPICGTCKLQTFTDSFFKSLNVPDGAFPLSMSGLRLGYDLGKKLFRRVR